jgi:hypothetical protein
MEISFDGIPMPKARVLQEMRDSLDCVGVIGMHSKGSIHEGTDSFMIRDVPHVVKHFCGQWGLCRCQQGASFHWQRNWLEFIESRAAHQPFYGYGHQITAVEISSQFLMVWPGKKMAVNGFYGHFCVMTLTSCESQGKKIILKP